jgi:hypothetical protein
MTESADWQFTSLSMIRCWSKSVPARFWNSSNAASKSDLSSGEGLMDMTLEEMEESCDS